MDVGYSNKREEEAFAISQFPTILPTTPPWEIIYFTLSKMSSQGTS